MAITPADTGLELAASLLAATDSATRAGLIASAVEGTIPDSACVVHRLLTGEDGESLLAVVGVAGSVAIADSSLAADNRLLASIFLTSAESEPEARFYTGREIEREDYIHLNVSRTIAAIGYVPLVEQETLVGVLEIVCFGSLPRQRNLDALEPVLRLAGRALVTAENAEKQRQDLLDSVHRMSQLYDLEKSLNATLELEEVTALAPEKTQAMLDCQAVHLWLFEEGKLRLTASHGADATVEIGMTQDAGEGYVGDMAEEGEALLIDDAEDERLISRNASLGEEPATPPIVTVLLAPLMHDEAEVGVLEAVNKTGGIPFDEDDQFFLSAMAETVGNALKNASLMHAERKLEILETLVHVSSEITSTLRLDRLMQIIVNSPQSVLPFERCSVALDHRGALQLKAVSGRSSLPMGDAQIDRLTELVRWLSSEPEALHLRLTGDEELPPEVARHFEATGYRGLYSLPLIDDQGRVGLLLYEGGDPEFLDLPHTEMIKILAGQATVAIRNALLYREVPLIGLLEPLVQRKRAIFRSKRSSRIAYTAAAAVALLFLFFCPLPMRVAGTATIGAQHVVNVTAPMEGTISAVSAHEGQRVAAGEALGAMNDWQWRMDLTAAEAKYRTAEMAMEGSLARGSAEAGADRAQAEFLRAELSRAKGKLDAAQLRSPIAGVVTTPALQNAVGEHLDAGAAFAQVLDLSTAVVDVAVPQRDVALVSQGQSAAIKLDSYPQRSWRGTVEVVSPEASVDEGSGDRTFAARVPLDNGDATLRAGMTGRAKIFVGYRPAGYVLLRGLGLWLWQTLWNWIGW